MHRPETPVSLAEDLDLLAGSGLLLETALALARSEANQAFTPVELGKKLVPALRQPVAAAVRRQVERRSLPATVGWLVHKNRPLLFLLADVRGAATGGPRLRRGVRAARPPGGGAQLCQPGGPAPGPAG